MDDTVKELFNKAKSLGQSEKALSDIRYLIERNTMNRFGESEKLDYLETFYDKALIDYRLNDDNLEVIKYFLIYLLFNFPDRAGLVAKCLKLLFSTEIREALCTAIEFYMTKDDHTTCELMYAITDVGDPGTYLSNKRIFELFVKLSKHGQEFSKSNAIETLNLLC
jgi:hypothetical protein